MAILTFNMRHFLFSIILLFFILCPNAYAMDFIRNADKILKIETAFFTFFAVYAVFCAFLYLNRIREKEYISFGLSFLIYDIYYILDSFAFYESGLRTYFIEKIIIALSFLFLLSILYSLLVAFNEKITISHKFIISYFAVLSFVAILFPNFEKHSIFIFLQIFAAVLFGITAFYLTTGAYKRNEYESGPVLIGIIMLLTGGSGLILDLAGIITFSLYGHSLCAYFVIFWMISIMYALIARYARILNNVKILSGRIQFAHEEERKRLAEELHDSLAQDILTAKLNLQKVNKDIGNKEIAGIIREISKSIDNLRCILKGLMPVPLKVLGIEAAIKTYSKKFSENTGIHTMISAEISFRPLPATELNLFRIFQEALNNIAKHSGADKVNVSLKSDGTILVMEIKDNGCGFDYNKEFSDGCGMGLSIIAERVRNMKGILTVKTKKREGTNIRVEVLSG